jgi:hypothetical protein
MDLRQRHRIIPCVAVQGAGCKAHFVLTPPPQPPQPAYLDTFNVQILSYTPIQNLEQDADYNLQPPPIFDYVTTIDVPLAIVIGTFPACTRLSSPGWSDTIDHIDSPDNFNWTIWNGTHIHVDPSDACESAWEKAWSSITNFISGAVNWVADAYNGIVADVTNAIASALSAVDIPGAHTIAAAIVDTVMSCVGIPPTLPDVADLENMGKDYLVDLAADQAGIDPSIAEAGVDKAISSVKTAQDGGGAPGNWYKPDPAVLFHPAELILQVTYTPEPNPKYQGPPVAPPTRSPRRDIGATLQATGFPAQEGICGAFNDEICDDPQQRNGWPFDGFQIMSQDIPLPPLPANSPVTIPISLGFTKEWQSNMPAWEYIISQGNQATFSVFALPSRTASFQTQW